MLHIPGPFPAELLCMCERCELVLRIDSQYQALMPPRGKKQVAQAFIVQYRYSTRNTIFTFQYVSIAIFVRPLLATLNTTYMHLCLCKSFPKITDYGRPEREQSSLHGQKFTPTPTFSDMAEAYFVCHVSPIFQISLIYAFIECPQLVTRHIQIFMRLIYFKIFFCR